MLARFIILCCLTVYVAVAFGQTDWTLRKDKNGIKVYTTKEPGQKFESIKVEAQLTGTLQKLMAILTDVPSTKNWVYATKEAYIIREIKANDIIYYTRTALPWPVSDRDIAIHMQLNKDEGSNTLKVLAIGYPNGMPAKKGIVRITSFYSLWDVKFDGKSKLNIIYILKMNPGGSVPARITNMFITKGPYETFDNLANLLKQ